VTPLDKPLTRYQRVEMWLRDYKESWGTEDPELDANLRALAQFCAMVEKDPDTICNECLRPMEGGGERIRYKARRYYIEQIEAFERTHEGGRRAANAVRSFLIHNGIAMGGRVDW
jgi:hypothetical protein